MSRRNILMSGAAAVIVVALGYWWFAARPLATDHVATAGFALSRDGVLAVDAGRAAQMDIRLSVAEPATDLPLAAIPAVIQPSANARVAVAATLPGTVLRTLVVEGDSVTKGQPLAVVASRDILAIGADLSRARARLGVAEANAARLARLSREGVIAGARADEAEALAAAARADVAEQSKALAMVNGRSDNGSYTLIAPIAGRVTSATVHAGDPLDGGSAPYVIDAANRYEVLGQLPERLVGEVRPGMRVNLPPGIVGRIAAVGTTIDPATRSASLKAEIPAAAGIVAGRTTTIVLTAPAPAGAVRVPDTAVTMVDGGTAVFVPIAGGYKARPVTVGGGSDGESVLTSGLAPGEEVVVSGTSALKALALGR